jgi:hypothetical protein
MEHGVFARFDAAMIAIHDFVAADRSIIEAIDFLRCRSLATISSGLYRFPI